MTYNGLDMLHKVIEVNKSKLSFKMSELAQVATSVTTFEFSKREVSTGIGSSYLFSARKPSWTQKTSSSAERHVSINFG